MPDTLRVLIVEDNPSDAELVVHTLKRAGFVPQWRRVETENEYLSCLNEAPELILADAQLPQFAGLRALDLLHERGLDIPFLLVSGSLGEDLAVNAMKRGAYDYLLKDRLSRLGEAVKRALEQRRLRAESAHLERQLLQSQKMEAIGQLAGGVAHDFNNLLTVILGYSDIILRDLGQTDPLREKVSEIQKAGQRAANLTKQLLAFSRKQILKPQILELNSTVSNITQMLERLLGEHIQISLHLDAGLGQVQADPTQLEQVLVNLAVNARDAMPNGGQLTIESRNVEMDEHTAALQGVPPGRYVLLVVSDTGFGMNEQTKARVFEPFFTTKEVGKGTGLGLSMVFGVVKQSGGTVTIYSEIGVGTTFRIYLPRLDAPAAELEKREKSHQLPARTGATILLVEDEPSLRALAREVLRDAGYVIFEASNGKEALQVARDLTGPPDLLLTDVVMPEMSGLELAEELQRKWPGLSVLYTSGYTDHALLERNTLRPDMPFLQKPYMPESLLEQVAAVLGNLRADPVAETLLA